MSFDKKYWDSRILNYLESDWSLVASPFAVETLKFIKPHSRILELGAGAGQDSSFFAKNNHEVVVSDATDAHFKEIISRNEYKLECMIIDVSNKFPFPDNSFDVIYAQLSLHYFNNEDMARILSEIRRVIKPKGIFACMLNSTKDAEYQPDAERQGELLLVDGIWKRYFTKDTLKPFVGGFDEVLFDELGKTAKDDNVGTSGMIRYIGRKKIYED